MGVFQPRYIFSEELSSYGLGPGCGDESVDIQALVDTASIMIDEYCGRTDGDGNGSLVYTTYTERLLAAPGRNIYVIPRRPLVALTAVAVSGLQAADAQQNGHVYNDVQASINYLNDGTLSAIISASGRYTYTRRDSFQMQDQYSAWLNPLDALTLFGGPPPWTAIDMVNLDYDSRTGQLWLSAGLYLSRYTEVVVTYTSGYNPLKMPTQVKTACACITKNLLAKGSGTTGMTSFSAGNSGINAQFDPDVIDGNVRRLLQAFVTVKTA